MGGPAGLSMEAVTTLGSCWVLRLSACSGVVCFVYIGTGMAHTVDGRSKVTKWAVAFVLLALHLTIVLIPSLVCALWCLECHLRPS